MECIFNLKITNLLPVYGLAYSGDIKYMKSYNVQPFSPGLFHSA